MKRFALRWLSLATVFVVLGWALSACGDGGSDDNKGGDAGGATAGSGASGDDSGGGDMSGGDDGTTGTTPGGGGGVPGPGDGGAGNADAAFDLLKALCAGTLDVTSNPEAACVVQNCGDQVASCYGSDWQSGNFGGACGAFMECTCQCESPQDIACLQGCLPQLTSECQACSDALTACATDAGCGG